MANKTPPPWLIAAVANGLQRLLLLALAKSPATETIQGTALVWAEAFMDSGKDWQQALDEPRIEKAFRKCAVEAEKFPTPKQVLQLLPKREQVLLARPKLSPQQRQANQQRLARLIATSGL